MCFSFATMIATVLAPTVAAFLWELRSPKRPCRGSGRYPKTLYGLGLDEEAIEDV
jgi:hypothetical protein